MKSNHIFDAMYCWYFLQFTFSNYISMYQFSLTPQLLLSVSESFNLWIFFLEYFCFQALFHKQLSSDRAIPDRVPQPVCGLHISDHLLQSDGGSRLCPQDPSWPHCVGDRRPIFPAQTGSG